MHLPSLNSKNIFACDLTLGTKAFHLHLPNSEYYIVYAPLGGRSFISDRKTLVELEKIAADKTDHTSDILCQMENTSLLDKILADKKTVISHPSQFTKLSILPNLRCNFACSYCYSAAGRSSVQLTKNKVKTILDFFMDALRTESKERTIFISGGGEPLLSWPIVLFAIQYSRRLAAERGLQLELLLMTNGSLINEQIIGMLKDNNVQIGLSFEILPDIQNTQRGHYDTVAAVVNMLSHMQMAPSISSVITPANVGRMSEMAQYVIENYPMVRHLNFDPAMSNDLFESPCDLDLFYDKFIDNFFEAKQLCGKHNITLDCNAIRHMEKLFPRYCQGKLALVPNGDISVCHTVSSSLEENYKQYIYGCVTDDDVVFDVQKFQSLVGSNLLEECSSCIARWHCGGGCLMYRTRYEKAKMEVVCRFTRRMAATVLFAKIDIEYQHRHGKSICEFI